MSVTVVIPAYNAQDTLHRAIFSVLAQTSLPREIIVVDDSSEDATAACAEAFRDRGRAVRIEVVRLPTNRGPAAARNAGWDLASGDHIAFLDADDSWHPQKLEIQHRWMMEHPEYAFSAHPLSCARQASDGGPYSALCRSIMISPWKLKISSCLLWSSSLMFRTELKQRFNPAMRYGEDRLLVLEMVLGGFKAARLEAPLGCLYKAAYGEKGLSRDLWKVERGELRAFRQLRQMALLGSTEEALLAAFSLAKYVARVGRCKCRSLHRMLRREASVTARQVDSVGA
ncbi:MAG: glycosyltransferase family 2 protein [Phycisphaerae bacterium]|nr:glycosyltransferase family 2 protein [Phycisphaerae bacterium]